MPGLWQTKKLADGSEVRVELCGDEYAHFWRTVDGVQYKESDGVLYPVTTQELQPLAQSRRALSAPLPSRSASARSRSGEVDASPFIGSKKGLIILVEFANKSFAMDNPLDYYYRMANEPGFRDGRQQGSVHDYFMAQSDGLFNLTFDVVGPVKMSKNSEYYGKDADDGSIDVNLGEMLLAAINMVNNQVTWSDYDWNNDGEVEQVYFIYAGGGQATSGVADEIWPHKWNLSWAVSSANGYPIQRQGMSLDVYACSNEVFYDGSTAGIGTICHEFSHCLGLPDTYDTSENDVQNYGMGYWDLMSAGNYNGAGYIPAGYNSWQKMAVGWKEPVTLDTDKYVTGMLPQSEGGTAYIVYNPANSNEYYMLENRAKTNWDAALPGEGMLILHVDYDEELFLYYNCPNGYAYGNDHQRFTIFHADNAATDKDEMNDTYPYGNLNVLSKYSKPAAAFYNTNADGTSAMIARINRITRADDGTMSFVYGDLAKADASVLFAESFDDCNGSGANDGNWSTVYVARGEFRADEEGWTNTGTSATSYGGRHCARVGADSPAAGAEPSITTREITFSGDCTLSFRTAPFTSSTTVASLGISVSNSDITLSQTDATLESQAWSEYTVSVTGKGKATITFTSPDCGFYLDDVLVRDNTVTGIEDIRTDDFWSNGNAGSVLYDLQGRPVRDTSLRGIYISNGVKVLR